jgi:hypothetical protein
MMFTNFNFNVQKYLSQAYVLFEIIEEQTLKKYARSLGFFGPSDFFF